MAKSLTPIVGLTVVVALALAAVFGSMSLAGTAQASGHEIDVYVGHQETIDLADHLSGTGIASYVFKEISGEATGAQISAGFTIVDSGGSAVTLTADAEILDADADSTPSTELLLTGAPAGLPTNAFQGNTSVYRFEVEAQDSGGDEVDSVTLVISLKRSMDLDRKQDSDGDDITFSNIDAAYTETTLEPINLMQYYDNGAGTGKIVGFHAVVTTVTAGNFVEVVDSATGGATGSIAKAMNDDIHTGADGMLTLKIKAPTETMMVSDDPETVSVYPICRTQASADEGSNDTDSPADGLQIDEINTDGSYRLCAGVEELATPATFTVKIAESTVSGSGTQIPPQTVEADDTIMVSADMVMGAFAQDGMGAGMITDYDIAVTAPTLVFGSIDNANVISLLGINKGVTTVTITAMDGISGEDDPTAAFVVRVIDPVDEVVVVDEPATAVKFIMNQYMTVGDRDVVMDVSGYFSDGSGNGAITGYSAMSSDEMVATAMAENNGRLTVGAVAAGSATVTVTAMDGNADADPMQTFMVMVEAAAEDVVEYAPYTRRTPMGSMVDPMSDAFSFESSSDEPGDGARYDIKFKVDNEVDTLNDELVIKMEDFGFPSSMSTGSIGITVNEMAGTSQDRQFSPEAVVVGSDKLTITIGDMLTRDDTREDFRISAESNIDIVIRQSAGISNPTEAANDKYGPKVTLAGQTIDGPEDKEMLPMFRLDVPHVVKLSEEDGGIGDTVTAEGLGFKNGTTLHFFVDKNMNDALDTNEDVICSVPAVGGDDVGSCEFVVSSPTFVGGDNYVNAVDGRNNNDVMMDDDQKFTLKPSLSATPAGGSPGELILIQLTTFPNNVAVSRVAIGGRNLDKNSYSGSVGSQGTGTFSITVPNWAVPGKQQLKVWAGSEDADTNITIGGPRVTVTPAAVLANQRISLVGTGFSSSAEIARVSSGMTQVSKITVSGEQIAWSRINAGEPVDVDSGGNWSASVDLPLSDATTGAGERIIRVTDSGGRTGSITVTIPDRTVTITPEAGRVGTIAVVRGTGFPSKNDEGSSFNVEIVYDAGNDKTTTVSAVPDASGRFEAQLRIPSTAAIPSSNQVTVTFEDDDDRAIPTSVTHEVPEADIELSATSGGPGTQLTINGIGFKAFVPVNLVRIGTVDITPAPKPTTDGNGMVTFNVLIPGLDVGIQTLEMEVGRTTASTGFTVTESGINPGDIVAIAAGTEDLGDNLVSVWHFNNDTKVWSFYDPTLEEGNTLTHLITGESYLIRVSSTQEVILNHDTRSLTCVGGNCWNQIVW